MGVSKKGGSWFIDYRVKGRRKRERIGPSKELAKKVLNKRLTQIAEGTFLDVKKIPKVLFRDLVDDYLEYSKANKKNYSREVYLVRRLREAFGSQYLGEITNWKVEKYKAERKKKVSPATVNRELTLLKHMFTMAVQWGKALENPVRGVKSFRESNARMRFLREEEEDRLLAECPESLQPLVLTAIHTGFRRGELLALKWTDVDFPNGLLTVRAAYAKNSERRTVPMSKTLRAVLTKLKEGQPDDGPVFLNGRDARYASPRHAFVSAVEKAGLVDFRFHDLRHYPERRIIPRRCA